MLSTFNKYLQERVMNLSTFMSKEWHFIDEVGQLSHQWQKSQNPHSQDKWILILVMTLVF